ncbi:MAG: 5-methyltetrahydropteroyltriglutamate--homocysteine S-methyltransferase [Clostridiales bacterium]|nr:5-methyltetrahydropteroyltriglutamate--homocysteine S-methyltransferase [Clostridiales bacterium]MBS5878186.1 5-methyltetrahydropteroyltriglutamate--homocysteine S-methyltransferase [Clostridiales bacterium]MDU0939344.1 5-methyltetrahydropteroyltriglutamate--homocysteine S-methyltransferase [Clostridiales bacterium]MDU1042328.1 5-methyltetrahydropteroyltriglutamate--homocysteine S-methyltransferase [Clostridiales bacterium]MDU3490748.1 5-methyltetrahydropteroyltriglutamate--homocysteine S-me
MAAIIGFPRIGKNRELKFETEKYFKNEISLEELEAFSKKLRKSHWELIKECGIEEIPSNDFSMYDNFLDTCFLLNIIPKKLESIEFTDTEKYFALARGYQGEKGNIKAWPMKKWFNTNYHYIVPTLEKETEIRVQGNKIFNEFNEALEAGIKTRPVITGPFTLLALANYEEGTNAEAFKYAAAAAYREIFKKLADLGAEKIQLDEPALVKDLSDTDKKLFLEIYDELLSEKYGLKVLIQTYFGDVRDIYEELTGLDVDGIGLDFIEGRKTLEIIKKYGFPKDKTLYAGVVNGKNIWTSNYEEKLKLIKEIPAENIVLNTSCSLLHVPFTTENEEFAEGKKEYFAFAVEKLKELADLEKIINGGGEEVLELNRKIFSKKRIEESSELAEKISALKEDDFRRSPEFEEREAIQRDKFRFSSLPTTTIGSFPQTSEVRQKRLAFKRGELSQEAYDGFIAEKIKECIELQNEIGIDVLVHGEFERNDMVEYFGQNLSGYLFTKNGWVQSYGTRAVKPPVIWGDVTREKDITVKWSEYAQSLTDKYVKGMLTGPVTILNWSFPREDISVKESTLQIALAIKEEVLALESAGIKVIQIDEAALREKLPIRRSDWNTEYLDWAIPAFRLVHSGVQADTQIHTHMCYSEFTDIIPAIDAMDADVISFEASRSNLEILDELQAKNFKTQVGPGVYDIHSPRIPSVEEFKATIEAILDKVPENKLWINPDCGLKTRENKEVEASLRNMIQAAAEVRKEL